MGRRTFSTTSTLASAMAALVAGCATGPVSGQESSPWAQLALLDLGGMREILRANHPGFVDHENAGFLRTDAAGFETAAALARSARSLDGYTAALQRYAGAFRDGEAGSGRALLLAGQARDRARRARQHRRQQHLGVPASGGLPRSASAAAAAEALRRVAGVAG
jgi:hypothetical protein